MEDLKIKSKAEEKISRRSFLRKAAYVAPVVVTLGALNAHAFDKTQATSVFTMYGGTGGLSDEITNNTTEVYKVYGKNGGVLGGENVAYKTPGHPDHFYESDAVQNNQYDDVTSTGEFNPFHQYFSQIIER